MSPWAVAALLLGIASALAHAHPILWSLPFVAVAVGAIALRTIAQNDGLTGTRIASIGIASACLFGSWAVVRAAVAAQVVRQDAIAYTNILMELVQKGDSVRLHQQSLNAAHRGADAAGLASTYRDSEDIRRSLEKFTQQEPMHTTLQIGPSFQWTISPQISQTRLGSTRELTVPIHVSGTFQGEPWERDTVLYLQRSYEKPLHPWRIMDWRLREP